MSAVIFDLDGVLIESEPYWQRGFADVVNEYAAQTGWIHRAFEATDMARFQGGRVPDTIATLLSSLGHPDAGRPEIIERLTGLVIDTVSAEFGQHPAPIVDSVAVARSLAARGTRMAVASSSAPQFIDAAITELGLTDAFPVRQSALGLEHGKPHPEVYLLTARRLGEDPRACVAIEDSPAGIGAAVAAGMTCIGLWRGAGDPPEVFKQCAVCTTQLTERNIDDALASP